MSTSGIFNTSNFATHQLKPSFSSKLFQMMPGGNAPLLAFSSQLQSEVITNTEHSWNFQDYTQPQCTTTSALGAATSGAVALVQVDDVSLIVEGQILVDPNTMENLLVTGVVGTTISLRRGMGSTTPAAIPAGTLLVGIGTAFEESSLRPLPQARGFTECSNLTQIFRNTWGVSGTAAALATQIGESAPAFSKKDAMMNHTRDIELAMLFGQKYRGILKGQPLRKMGGIYEMLEKYAPENIMQAPKTTTYDDLEEMIDPIFNVVTDQVAGNDRLIYTDAVGARNFSKLGRLYGNIQMQSGETKFGHRFTEFKAGRGNFKIMEHPLFNTLPFARGMAMIVDLSSMGTAYLPGRETDYKDFNPNANSSSGTAQDNGIDATGGAFLTEMTVTMGAPKANGIILGLCEVGLKTVVAVTNLYGWISVNFPCLSGSVDPGTSVTITIQSKPSTAIKVQTPTGVVTITTNANGAGSAAYVVGSAESYLFSIVPDPLVTTVTYTHSSATVCVTQPCLFVPAAEQECGAIPVEPAPTTP